MAGNKRLRITISLVSKQLLKLSALFYIIFKDSVANDPTKLVGKTKLQINFTKPLLLRICNIKKIEPSDAFQEPFDERIKFKKEIKFFMSNKNGIMILIKLYVFC
jgi:hypothetical protein